MTRRGFGMKWGMTRPTRLADKTARLRIRIVFGDDAMLGPGKADLLEAIRDTGSIAAAGRSMGMSYKRAWMLVEALNTAFRAPLVDAARGGAKGGGAGLTPTGHEVLAHYRSLEVIMADAGADRIAALRAMLGDMSDGK
jgi:molybdate transport system regulatory protein